MRTFSSTLGLILLLPMFLVPAQAWAQQGPAGLSLGEPYRELQYAFANGFETAVRHIASSYPYTRNAEPRSD